MQKLGKNYDAEKKGLRACSPVLRRSQPARGGALRSSSHTQCTRLMMMIRRMMMMMMMIYV